MSAACWITRSWRLTLSSNALTRLIKPSSSALTRLISSDIASDLPLGSAREASEARSSVITAISLRRSLATVSTTVAGSVWTDGYAYAHCRNRKFVDSPLEIPVPRQIGSGFEASVGLGLIDRRRGGIIRAVVGPRANR